MYETQMQVNKPVLPLNSHIFYQRADKISPIKRQARYKRDIGLEPVEVSERQQYGTMVKEKKQLATVVHKYRPSNVQKRREVSERFETETKSQRSLESSQEKEKMMILKTVLQEKREKPVIQLMPTTLVSSKAPKSPHALSPLRVQQVDKKAQKMPSQLNVDDLMRSQSEKGSLQVNSGFGCQTTISEDADKKELKALQEYSNKEA